MAKSRRDKRLFARFDLDYADHPKIGDLSDSAFRAHVEMILYARKYLTDGLIPKRVANRFAYQSLTELCSNDPEAPSLIKNDDGSYTLHGYADMNETREEVEKRSLVAQENGRKGGRKPNQTGNQTGTQLVSETEPSSEPVSQAETETETDIEVTTDVVTFVSSPDKSDDQGNLLPDDWRPNQKHIDQANALHLDVKQAYQKFRWHAETNQRRQKNWNAAFTNWLKQGAVIAQKSRGGRPPQLNRAQARQEANLSVIDQLAAVDAAEMGAIEA